MRRRPPSRDVQGVLVVAKDPGMTSHDVVQRVRRLYGTTRVGHAGTLDPDASGVLVVLLGGATRVAEFLQEDDKEYRITLLLGRETDTQDVTGAVLAESDPSSVTEEGLRVALGRFTGTFLQVPPSYSAVKVGGQPLYKLARAGQTVVAAPREVTVRRCDLTRWAPPRAELVVTCSKGTYMRTLCHDLGRALGVGGCLETLVRTRSGSFTLAQARPLEELASAPDRDAFLLPVERWLPFPRWEASAAAMSALREGRPVPWTGGEPTPGEGSMVAVMAGGILRGVGVVRREGESLLLAPRKVLA